MERFLLNSLKINEYKRRREGVRVGEERWKREKRRVRVSDGPVGLRT